METALDYLLSTVFWHFDEYHGNDFRGFVERVTGRHYSDLSPSRDDREICAEAVIRYCSLMSRSGKLCTSLTTVFSDPLGRDSIQKYAVSTRRSLTGAPL